MSDLTCVDNTQVRVLRFARRLLCLPLPEGFVPPVKRDALAALSERVGEALALEALTPRLVKLGEAQWMMVFFHGPERLHRMATYEEGQPRSLSYAPREMAMVVVDGQHRLMYVSMSQKRKPMRALLSALNGTVFPERSTAEQFYSFQFDLDVLPALQLADRQPQGGLLPWQNVTLKSVSSQEPGRDVSWSTKKWGWDGFEELAQQAFSWPRHLCEVGLRVQPLEVKRAFSVRFFQAQGALRATLAPQTLSSLAGLVQLCSHNGEMVMRVE